MKNWLALEADIDLIMNKHYTPGRNGRRIDKVIIHHNAGNHLRLPSFSGHPISADLVSVGEDVHCES
ncbi:hypothetical protein QP880_10890, partial [Dermabacter hominis]|uniref:hypothetical protein n=1 Tax=Dermabacter hominis TaxID=36740 RepID=UPI003CCB97DD|nr:hypothetical protein [Dermabacter hominis]